MRALDDVVRTVSTILRDLAIDYVIVGGIAVSGWGNVRTTRDVDLIIDLKKKDISRLVKELKDNRFDISEKDIKEAMKEKVHFTIFDRESEYHIDAKGSYGVGEKRSLQTKRSVELWSTGIFIASPEDTIANKLVFGSEQDIRDALSIYVRQMGKLDMNYLEELCRAMGVSRELADLKRNLRKKS